MKILILGNGFDLEHGLPTRYWDFIEFVNLFKKIKSYSKDKFAKLPEFQKLNPKVQEYLLGSKVYNFEEHNFRLKKLEEYISNNVWIDYFVSQQDMDNKGWIDFEYEISEVIKALDYLKKYNKRLAKKSPKVEPDDRELYDKACSFLMGMRLFTDNDHNRRFKSEMFYEQTAKKVITDLNEDLNKLIICLEIYLEECVQNMEVSYDAPDIFEIGKVNKVLSFNYTNTYQRIYDTNNKIEYDYVHGRISSEKENNLVLGVDEYLDEDVKNKELDFIQFKKYFQRIYKKTGCKYKQWIDEIEQYTQFNHEVYIFGHSLDITDKDILKELIQMRNTSTTIFYYNKEVYASHIANLVKIIGQDELIESVYGANPKIVFKQQKPRRKREI